MSRVVSEFNSLKKIAIIMSALSSDIHSMSPSSDAPYSGKTFSGNPCQWAAFEIDFTDWAAQQVFTVRETVPMSHPQFDPANPQVQYDNTRKPASILVSDSRACVMELDVQIPFGRPGMSAQQERDLRVQQEIAKIENERITTRNTSKAMVLKTLLLAFLSAVPESTRSDLTVWRRSNREATFAQLVAYCRDTFTRTNPLSARVDLLAQTRAPMGDLPTARAFVAMRRKAFFDYHKTLFELGDPARMTPAIQQELFADTFMSGLELSYRGVQHLSSFSSTSSSNGDVFCMPKMYQRHVGRFQSDQDTLMLPTFTERLTRFEVRMQQVEAMAMAAADNYKAQKLAEAEQDKEVKVEIAKRDRAQLNAASLKEDQSPAKKPRANRKKASNPDTGASHQCSCGCTRAFDCTCTFNCDHDDEDAEEVKTGWDAIKSAHKGHLLPQTTEASEEDWEEEEEDLPQTEASAEDSEDEEEDL